MISRLLSKRYVRILLWLFTTFVTLVVLLYVWTNWSGRRRWAAVKAMVEREGETLEFRKLLPETPPEAQNLLAIEPLRGIALVVDNDPAKGEPGARRKALEALNWKQMSVPTANGVALAKLPVVPAANGVTLGKTTGIQDWVEFLRDTKYLDLPAGPEVSGREVLAALDAKFPLLKQLADETSQRPLAMMTPGLRERELPEFLLVMGVPYLTTVQSIGKVLALRARAAVAAGAGAEAARCILAVHQLAQACEQEPLLISFLMGNSLEMQALESVWLGLRERVFAEDDLQQLQRVFTTDHVTAAMLLAMRGEMAAGANMVDFLQLAASGQQKVDPSLAEALAANGGAFRVSSLRVVPQGLFEHWKSALVDLEVRHLIQPLKHGGLRESVRRGDEVLEELTVNFSMLRNPDQLLARLTMPAVTTVSCSALLQDARRQQALAALALERFFVKNSRYPAALADLVPEFLPAIPLDPCDGKPLRYRTTPAGRYQLWSVGFDGKDDDGKVTLDAKGSAKLNKREYKGDWTWQYEPVK